MPIQRIPFALFGGQQQPGVGFDPIDGESFADEMEHRQAGLGRGEALQRGLAQQVGGPPEIPVRLQGVVAAQLEPGGGVALGGGFPDPAQRGPLVGRQCPWPVT